MYPIFITPNDKDFRRWLAERRYARHAILVDEHTKADCLPILMEQWDGSPSVIEIPSGERYKTIDTCQYIWQQMAACRMGRDSLLVNLGGGVIGDMGGFCASTYKRGIDFLQIPTTLLSQVDASVGGKLGVDFMGLKNAIGLFNDPIAVWIHPRFLRTLPLRELRSGFAEAIKHALIQDASQWGVLQKVTDLEWMEWSGIIRHSVDIKKRIVEQDPFEKGARKALNFGHTIGHAVESVCLASDAPLLHGEAIAIGMICETFISYQTTGLPLSDLEHITRFILGKYDHVTLHPDDFQSMLDIMRNDKKNEGEAINFTLLPRVGEALVNQTADEGMIRESLAYYNGLSQAF